MYRWLVGVVFIGPGGERCIAPGVPGRDGFTAGVVTFMAYHRQCQSPSVSFYSLRSYHSPRFRRVSASDLRYKLVI